MRAKRTVWDDLLSIDVDAHLKKLAGHTYKSPLHYPVELVRSALRRGADRIRIRLDKRHVRIRDNGAGIPLKQIDALADILEADLDPDRRERAILNLQREEGLGLLAILTPTPRRLRIETLTAGRRHRIHLQNRRLVHEITDDADRPVGSEITLWRQSTRVALEARILRAYCRGVGARIDLNDIRISQGSLLRHPLVSLRLRRDGNGLEGEIGIPAHGDVCRIWFLDQGIPRSRKAFAPWKGTIFEAALEYDGEVTTRWFKDLEQPVRTLYTRLIHGYLSRPTGVRQRIDSLFFRHHRENQDRSLVESLPAFGTAFSGEHLTLTQLEEAARTRPVQAFVDENGAPSALPPLRQDTLVLRLNRTQMDFLLNQTSLDVTALTAETGRIAAVVDRIWRFKEKSGYLLKRWCAGRRVPVDRLRPEEEQLLHLLDFFFARQRRRPTPLILPENIFFVHGRGRQPYVYFRTRAVPETWNLALRRAHPLIRGAIGRIRKSAENIDIAGNLFLAVDPWYRPGIQSARRTGRT